MENQKENIVVPVDTLTKEELIDLVSLLSDKLQQEHIYATALDMTLADTRMELEATKQELKEQEQDYLNACTKVDEVGDELKDTKEELDDTKYELYKANNDLSNLLHTQGATMDIVDTNMSDIEDIVNDAQIEAEHVWSSLPYDAAKGKLGYACGYYDAMSSVYRALHNVNATYWLTDEDANMQEEFKAEIKRSLINLHKHING